MWGSKEDMHKTSISVSVIVLPLVLISVVVLALSPQNYSLASSWKSLFFSSNSSSKDASADQSHESSYVIRSLISHLHIFQMGHVISFSDVHFMISCHDWVRFSLNLSLSRSTVLEHRYHHSIHVCTLQFLD